MMKKPPLQSLYPKHANPASLCNEDSTRQSKKRVTGNEQYNQRKVRTKRGIKATCFILPPRDAKQGKSHQRQKQDGRHCQLKSDRTKPFPSKSSREHRRLMPAVTQSCQSKLHVKAKIARSIIIILQPRKPVIVIMETLYPKVLYRTLRLQGIRKSQVQGKILRNVLGKTGVSLTNL